MHRAAAGLFLALLAGCTAEPAAPVALGASEAPYTCLLPQEKRMLVAELFFGRNAPGRGPVTEAEWAAFAAEVVSREFPDGFTVLDGAGQWRNPQTGAIAREPSKILVVVAERTPELRDRLTRVIDTYRARFRQLSVGIVTRTACAAF